MGAELTVPLWCTQRGQTIQQVIEADVRRHLLTPAVAPIPRDRALARRGRSVLATAGQLGPPPAVRRG